MTKRTTKKLLALILAAAMTATSLPGMDVLAKEEMTEVSESDVEETAEEKSASENSVEDETTEDEVTQTAAEDASEEEKESENLSESAVVESTVYETESENQSEEESETVTETENVSEEELETVVKNVQSSSEDFVIENGVLKKYNGSDEEVTIPDSVTGIGSQAFKGNTKIKKVVFVSSVTTIGDSAFDGCSSLYQVELNEGLTTIGRNAFGGAPLGQLLDTGAVVLGTLTIPSTVQSIGYGAFVRCKYLGEVIFSDGDNQTLTITSNLNDATFGYCENLTKVDLPDRLTVTSYAMFCDDSSLKEVKLGKNLETIGELTFAGCGSLTDLEFPASLITIGDNAFWNCKSLKAPNLKEGLKNIGENAFSGTAGGEKLSTGEVKPGTLTIPSTVQSIDKGAFSNCPYLGEVIFIDGDTVALTMESWPGDPTFGDCQNLTKVDLPERLEVIPQCAFKGCTKLREVLFGNSLKTIGDSAFSGCSSLKAPKLSEGLVAIGQYAFERAPLGEVLDTGVVELGTLTIPSTVQSIGMGAFAGCSYLGEVIFADGDTVVLKMDSQNAYPTFGGCQNLKKVDLPERLEAIPQYAFKDCKNLQEVSFGNSLKTIGIYAFQNCENLSAVKLNEGLKSIGERAFENTAFGTKSPETGEMMLGTLTIPSTVQSIGDYAFGCKYLEKAIFANGDTEVLTTSKGIVGGSSLKTIILPERIKKLAYWAFYGNPQLEKLYIPEGVTEIADQAIYNCPKVTIYGVPGSAAETYAKKNNIPFKNKDELDAGEDEPEQADSKPNIDDSKCIINLRSNTKRGILSIYPVNGYEIDTNSLAIKKTNGADSQFTIAKVEGSATQYAVTGNNLAKGTYKVVLHVKTSAGEQQAYKIPFTIQVVDKQPQVKVTQETLQLYKKDGRGKVLIDTDMDMDISKIVYTPKSGTVVLEQKETSCEEACFTYGISSNANASNYLTAGTKGTLEIWFEGYSEPYKMNLTLKVDKKLPKFTASSVTLYPTKGINETTIKIVDENGKGISTADGYSVSAAGTKYVDVIPMSDSTPLKVRARDNAKNETLKLSVSNTNWIPSVKVSCAVKVAKNPKLVFSSARITLNTLDDGEYKFAGKQVAVTPYIKGASDVVLERLTFTGKNAKSQAVYMDGKGALTLNYEDGVIKAAVDKTVAKGTYTYTVTAVTKDGLEVSAPLTISVTNAKPDVTVKAKGAIDVLNRKGSSVVYTITSKNFSDRIVNVALVGSDAGLFDLTFENGKATLCAKEGAELKIKSNYQLSMKVTFASGAELTKKVTVKLNQKNPKLSVNPIKLTMFQSASGQENGQMIAVRATGGAPIAKIELATSSDTFRYDYDGNGKGTLYVSGDAKAKVNKTYSLKLAVTLKDAATNANPIYVTVKVNYRK